MPRIGGLYVTHHNVLVPTVVLSPLGMTILTPILYYSYVVILRHTSYRSTMVLASSIFEREHENVLASSNFEREHENGCMGGLKVKYSNYIVEDNVFMVCENINNSLQYIMIFYSQV